MRILMVNKFLYPNGGSETYMFKLGEHLVSMGHQVQYFGMEHEGRCVGNNVNAYTSDMDFHGGSKLSKLTYPIKTIYSSEARKKLRLVLDDFKPDVVHLNNFNYQLTPSVILEIKKWSKQNGEKCRIVYTAHDYQLVCPNHMLQNPLSGENCEICLDGHFFGCTKGKCIHGSTAKSAIGTAEAVFWKLKGTYKHIDKIICCSDFMKSKMDSNPIFADKTLTLHNFTDFGSAGENNVNDEAQKDYVLYFGRYVVEKGVKTLVEAAKLMPNTKFVFAGSGPLKEELEGIQNITDLGFLDGGEIKSVIKNAKVTVVPSQWYEPFGLSAIESIAMGTPVIVSDKGGLKEIAKQGKTGYVFKAGDVSDLTDKIKLIYGDEEAYKAMCTGCQSEQLVSVEQYADRLLNEVY